MNEISDIITRIALLAVPLLLGVTLHEVAHGYVAYLHGDPTAKSLGRLTLNPIKHLDPAGTLIFVLLAMFSPVVIGWAKPVPVDPRYFKNQRRGWVLVSLAGPAANFLLVIFFAMLMKLIAFLWQGDYVPAPEMILWPLALICAMGVIINLVLGLFNLIPIPPLDGSKILAAVLPRELANKYLSIQRYGIFIVLILMFTGVLGKVVLPALNVMINAVIYFFNLPLEPFNNLF